MFKLLIVYFALKLVYASKSERVSPQHFKMTQRNLEDKQKTCELCRILNLKIENVVFYRTWAR